MASHAVSEAELEHLASRNRSLAEAVRGADTAGIEVRATRSGADTLAQGDVLLGSAYDPLGEADRQAEAASPREADLLLAVGIGLGRHIESFRAVAGCPVVIYEPSPARLRALLSVGGGSSLLAADDVYWARDVDELAALFKDLYVAGTRVRTWVHPAVARLDPEAAREALERLKRAKDAADLLAVTRVRMSGAWSHLTAENAADLLATPGFGRLAGAFEGVPAVVAAAGPSLAAQLPALRRLAGRVLVIAIGQSLRALRRAGIEPDLVHVIESQDVAHQIEGAGAPERENLVVGPTVHPSLFRTPVRTRFVATPVTNPLARWLADSWGEDECYGGGSTVALGAVRLAAALGANPIWLIGQDLAFTGDRCYADDTAYDMLALRRDDDGRLVYTNVRGKAALFGDAEAHAPERTVDVVMVESWDGGRVATSKSYASFIDQYAELGRHLADLGIRLVNCTEGGARIPGIEHRAFEQELVAAPTRDLRARARIGSVHDEAPQRDRRDPERAIARARRKLSAIEGELRRARRLHERARRSGPGVGALGALKGLAKSQRRLDALTGELPWLEGLIATELQHGAIATRQERSDDADLDAALEEAGRLIDTTGAAARAARALMTRLARRLEQGVDGDDRRPGREARARASGAAPPSGLPDGSLGPSGEPAAMRAGE